MFGKNLSKENVLIISTLELLSLSLISRAWDNYPKRGNMYTNITICLLPIIILKLTNVL